MNVEHFNSHRRFFNIIQLPLLGSWSLKLIDESEKWDLTRGLRCGKRLESVTRSLEFIVKRPGEAPDLSFDWMGVPVASPRAAELLRRFAPDDIQLIPALISGVSDSQVVNVITRIDCSTEKDTTIEIVRPDLIGNHRLFRLHKIPGYIVFSEKLHDAIRDAGLMTADFYECKIKE